MSSEHPLFDVVADGVVVRVHAQPGAARTEVAGVHGDAVKIRVREAPEHGRANGAVESVLADVFGVPTREVTVRSGATARRKRVHVRGVDAARAAAVLDAAIGR